MIYEDYYWLNKPSRTFLSRGYLSEGETAEERIRAMAERAEQILSIEGFADKFEGYAKRGFYSFATPVWTNFGNAKGLPISCNCSYVSDTMESIAGKVAEVTMMTKYGAGTAAYLGALRARGSDVSIGGSSPGPVSFARMWDVSTDVTNQSDTRRGNCAVYLDADHPDIMEFLQIREEGNLIQHLSIGVCMSDAWIDKVEGGDKEARKVWARIIKKRRESGYPYIFFTDNANNQAPQAYKDKGKWIYCTQLCTEIMNSISEDESFVCDLGSMNLLHWDEWKNTDAVETYFYFLDAVLTEYIEKVKDIPFMQAAYNFAVRQRSIGLGGLGWHSFLQSKMIAFESMEAKYYNTQIWQFIQEATKRASQELAVRYGEPELLVGYGMRNINTVAIAPTTSSAFILGQVSQSIEPFDSNYFVKDLAKGKFTYRNPHLKELLKEKEQDTPETWSDILAHGGSVQHLEFLSQHEKDVFKTFGEISQKEIAIQAAQRQKYIDQGQSLNFMIGPDVPPKEISDLLLWCHKNGLKSVYYQHSSNPSQMLARSIMTCQSCEA